MKSQETKRAEAEARQVVHDGLPTGVKLLKVAVRRGESTRERTRLLDGLTA